VTGESDAWADVLPDGAGDAQQGYPDAAAGKLAGPESDVPEPGVQTLLVQRPVAPVLKAPCIPDAVRYGAQSFVAQALPAGPGHSVPLTSPPEFEAASKRKLQATMLLRTLKLRLAQLALLAAELLFVAAMQ